MPLNDAQRAARLTRVGASEVSALLGDNPFMNERDVFDRIMGTNVVEVNEAMRMGNFLEPVFPAILKWRGMVTRTCHRAYVHSTLPLSATPDLYANPHAGNPRGLVECKVSSATMHQGNLPPGWYWQLQTQLMLAKRMTGYLAVLSGSRLVLETVQADSEAQDKVLEAVDRFDRLYLTPGNRPDAPDLYIALEKK